MLGEKLSMNPRVGRSASGELRCSVNSYEKAGVGVVCAQCGPSDGEVNAQGMGVEDCDKMYSAPTRCWLQWRYLYLKGGGRLYRDF
ncbi:hypothetical protein BHE74_00027056 [Ensete ventricosum]|nr:hypothetical protein GW17_00007853 [Ensete ventricosum]RWW65631.1 hypothetical protein BHE74_00027056 [Ensete ventricosum]